MDDDTPSFPDEYAPLVQFMEQGIPFNTFLGIRAERFGKGEVVLALPWADHLIGDPFRPAVHGGVTSVLADVAGGTACFTLLSNQWHPLSTVDLRVDYLRAVSGETLYCVANVVRMGNRVAAVRMEMYSGTYPGKDGASDAEAPAPFATGQAVYNVLRRPQTED